MTPSQLTGSRPNILTVIVHDLGQYLGCYGAPVRTPHLDAMAAEGVVFTHYCCSAASCSPSRGSIITGRYPHRNGLIGLAHLGWQLGGQEVTLPMYLNAAGYETRLLGHQHEHPEAQRLGYQHLDTSHGDARSCSDKVIAFLEAQAANPGERPFYVNSGWFEPHRPYGLEGYDNDDPAQVSPLPWLPDLPGIRQDVAGLHGLVYRVDECLGRIREALARTGLAESTLLVFTTDHGLAMPRAKGTCYDPGLKTALLMDWPGHVASGTRREELLTNCDLLPTVLDLAGCKAPGTLDGRTFLPLLTREPYEPRASIFAEMTWHDQYNPMRAIRTTRHKYIRNFGDRPLVFIPLDIYQAPAGQEMKGEYYGQRRPAEELYDLQTDPLEQHNLATDPAHADTLADLRAQVDDWMVETNDPLRYGDSPVSQALLDRWEKERWDNG
jgi:N-sulfoglucosamine sulfohydrolase